HAEAALRLPPVGELLLRVLVPLADGGFRVDRRGGGRRGPTGATGGGGRVDGVPGGVPGGVAHRARASARGTVAAGAVAVADGVVGVVVHHGTRPSELMARSISSASSGTSVSGSISFGGLRRDARRIDTDWYAGEAGRTATETRRSSGSRLCSSGPRSSGSRVFSDSKISR